MKITEKINLDFDGLMKYGAINIVAFGDSVTHGAVKRGEINYETVYWNRLRKKILDVRNYVPVNVINAGIGGVNALASVDRMESQALIHKPDLLIICFGLNDIFGPLENYINSLRKMFEKAKENNIDTIFMTPNMMNTTVADDTLEELVELAHNTAEMQNNGKMDLYIESAVELAKSMNITVCDCYAEWKKLSETQDITMLLANRINHPIKEMHELFAEKLFKTIFGEKIDVTQKEESTMYRG